MAHHSFQIFAPKWNPHQGKLALAYRAPDGTKFTEYHYYPLPEQPLAEAQQQALQQTFKALSIAAAVSYYKAFYPCQIAVDWPLTKSEAEFFSALYFHGLGEFAARNHFAISELKSNTSFQASNEEPQPTDIKLNHHYLTLVGGGKDSAVSIELLRQQEAQQTLMAVNPSPPIEACLGVAALPTLQLKRQLDPQLFKLNETGAPNGHVPITAIISLMATATVILQNMDTVVLSNERSAEEATTTHQGVEVNHQYSKSLAFESALASYITTHISPNLRYISLLRPLSEVQIAQLFSQTERYDEVFTSCNNAHKIYQQSHLTHNGRWCGRCPKCTFTYLLLAAQMPVARLQKIFGENLLEVADNIPMYQELCGLSGHKPWECVGELREAAATLQQLSQQPEWQNTLVVKELAPAIQEKYGDLTAEWQQLETLGDHHHLTPQEYTWLTHATA